MTESVLPEAPRARSAAVITVSDRCFSGLREDRGGPLAVSALRDGGWRCDDATIIPDGADGVEHAVRAAIAEGVELIVTTGGTGISPRDLTPEGTARVIETQIPGIPEELRRLGASAAPGGLLSRGVAGIAHKTLIVNLPGSTGAVRDGISVILRIADHVLSQLRGEDHG
ncbi:MogA/MoaB family molybdenum cofactor biosynthesis protein [Microbacterium amylolyticum]|uniref:Molybdenum cofactor synthesis domain-containing protein n=1 Tax=Microbacterium amylolyticum TaxID=936337 RepID=A0ABS4ZES7_9MICO|nr:MogA/MoaB family molybdenum cofactor biosynthesis protein [Microbacterium amylolyticum]MBP2435790.1 molybdenum cofactor synthesis domain-containing protein [Microbacterium amylolyticum]